VAVRLKRDTTYEITVRLKPDTTYEITVRLNSDPAGGTHAAQQLVRRHSGTPDDSGTDHQARLVHQRPGGRGGVAEGAERPGTSSCYGAEDPRSRSERRPACQGHNGARRAVRLQCDAPAARAAGGAGADGVRQALSPRPVLGSWSFVLRPSVVLCPSSVLGPRSLVRPDQGLGTKAGPRTRNGPSTKDKG